MLRYLIQVIENLLSAGILAALLWAAPDKEGGESRKKRALWGCAAGTAAALILTILRRTTALINRSYFNLWVLSFVIIFSLFYLLFLWGILQKLLRKIAFLKNRPALADAVPDYNAAILLGLLLFFALFAVFSYPAEFVLAGESVFSTDFLFKLIGFTAGLAAVIFSSLALYRTARGASSLFLKTLLTAALVMNTGNQAAVIIQFLMIRRIIPVIRWLFRIIIPAVNNSIVFLYILMGIGFLFPLVLFIGSLGKPVSGKNPAERRKFRSSRRVNRRRCLTITAGFALSVFLFTFVKSYIERGVVLSPAEPMTLAGDEIIIPITQVEDGHLHRFAYTASDNTEVRFIVIRKNAVAYGVGLDACDICGATGYYERKKGSEIEVICRLCDVVMNLSTIGFKGGCNPVPLAYSLRSGSMIIETINLENEKTRFK